jgi:uncharacterized membrane protein (DUF106 family)
MRIVLNIVDAWVDIVLVPFSSFHPLFGLVTISGLVGVIMVLTYRVTSNQAAIGKIKDQIKIHFMEVRIYKEDIAQTWIAQKKILINNFKYMGLSLKPALLLAFLIIFILAPLNVRYGYQSFKPEESFVVTVKTTPDKSPVDFDIILKTPETIETETPPLRLEEDREISWRLKAKKAGEYTLQFELPEKLCNRIPSCTVSKHLVIDHNGSTKIAPEIRQEGFLAVFYNPSEAPLPKNPVIDEIKINYPIRYFSDILGGWNLDWLVIFIITSLGFGFLVKKLLKIN